MFTIARFLLYVFAVSTLIGCSHALYTRDQIFFDETPFDDMFRHLQQDDSNWPSGTSDDSSHDIEDTDDAAPPPPPRCRSCSLALARERAVTSELHTKVSNRASSKAPGCHRVAVQRVPIQQRHPAATSHAFFCGAALALGITTLIMVLIGLIQHREQATCAASALCTIVKPVLLSLGGILCYGIRVSFLFFGITTLAWLWLLFMSSHPLGLILLVGIITLRFYSTNGIPTVVAVRRFHVQSPAAEGDAAAAAAEGATAAAAAEDAAESNDDNTVTEDSGGSEKPSHTTDGTPEVADTPLYQKERDLPCNALDMLAPLRAATEASLVSMGFPTEAVHRAAAANPSGSTDALVEWLLAEREEPTQGSKHSVGTMLASELKEHQAASAAAEPGNEDVAREEDNHVLLQLVDMGFDSGMAAEAAAEAGDLKAAVKLLVLKERQARQLASSPYLEK